MATLSKHILLAMLGITCTPLAQAMDLNQGLINAVRANNIQEVQELIDAGVDVNAQDYCRETALMKAANNDNKDTVGLLLNYDADINAQNRWE